METTGHSLAELFVIIITLHMNWSWQKKWQFHPPKAIVAPSPFHPFFSSSSTLHFHISLSCSHCLEYFRTLNIIIILAQFQCWSSTHCSNSTWCWSIFFLSLCFRLFAELHSVKLCQCLRKQSTHKHILSFSFHWRALQGLTLMTIMWARPLLRSKRTFVG